jgi:hypothetical protein
MKIAFDVLRLTFSLVLAGNQQASFYSQHQLSRQLSLMFPTDLLFTDKNSKITVSCLSQY